MNLIVRGTTRLQDHVKMRYVTKKRKRNYGKDKTTFKHSSSYVHTESILKRVSFWDWKSPAFAALGCHWPRSGNAQLSGWKIPCSILPTHKLYAATNGGQMQDIDIHHDGRNGFHKERGPHQYQANCCEIVRGTFPRSARYLFNQWSRNSMSRWFWLTIAASSWADGRSCAVNFRNKNPEVTLLALIHCAMAQTGHKWASSSSRG